MTKVTSLRQPNKMKIYIATINLPCLSYGDIFLVKAANIKEAQQKVYDLCKDRFNYKKSDIIIKATKELLYMEEIVEIH